MPEEKVFVRRRIRSEGSVHGTRSVGTRSDVEITGACGRGVPRSAQEASPANDTLVSRTATGVGRVVADGPVVRRHAERGHSGWRAAAEDLLTRA